MAATTIEVTGPQPYPVHIGTGLLAQVRDAIPLARRVAVLHPQSVAELAKSVIADLNTRDVDVLDIELEDGEDCKTLAIAARCFDQLAAAGFTRTDAIVGLGGGATTDLAGFVAASWLRGVRVVQVATTLAAMVDAAIGGKTGVNIGAGKNLVGAFHPPAAVICDVSTLSTLPLADYRAGLAEVVKCGFIDDPTILDLIEADPAAVMRPGNDAEFELIRRSVAVKARVVSQDLTEQGLREILNYGHTLGHAIEKREQYRWRHGEAISIGLVFAAELSRLTDRLDEQTTARHRSILSALELPVVYDGGAFEELLATMRIDKKVVATTYDLCCSTGWRNR